MARIFSVLRSLKRSSHYAYLGADFKRDIKWWQQFLPHFNSVSVIKSAQWLTPDTLIATDTCLKGAGGTFGKCYFAFTFPDDLKDAVNGINQLEAIAIIITLKLWSHKLKGCKFVIKCDNQTTVSVVNSGRAKEAFLQSCAREIAFLACTHEFETCGDQKS